MFLTRMCGAVLMIAGGLAIVWASTWTPASSIQNGHSTQVSVAPPAAASKTRLAEAATGLDLRRPLYDVPPPAPAPPPLPPPLLVKLMGTVIDGDRSRAIIQGADGKSEFKRVGERCGDAEVLRIEANRIVIRHLGNEVTLKVDRPGPGGAQ